LIARPIMARAPISMQIVISWLVRSLIANEGPPLETASPTDREVFFTRSPGSAQASPSRTLAPQSSTTSLFRHGKGERCAQGNHTHGPHGEAAMSVVLNDLLLFSCLTALVTGIVIAAATLLI